MKVTSTAFDEKQFIPVKYTCDGENINPPLTFSQVPAEVQSLAIIVEDPDAPSGIFTHWVVYNIPPSTIQILDNEVPEGGMQGMTDFGKPGYGGPCPPSGTHRYFFKLFAIDKMLSLPDKATREEVEQELKGHIIESAELVGLYARG